MATAMEIKNHLEEKAATTTEIKKHLEEK